MNSHNTNTYNLIAFGNEDISKFLTEEQIFKILCKGFNSLQCLIDAQCKIPELQNIFIPNLRSNTAYIADPNSKQLKSTDMNDAVRTITENRIEDINKFQEKFADDIPKRTDKLLNQLQEDYDKDPNRHHIDTKRTIYENSSNFNTIYKEQKKTHKIKTIKTPLIIL